LTIEIKAVLTNGKTVLLFFKLVAKFINPSCFVIHPVEFEIKMGNCCGSQEEPVDRVKKLASVIRER